MPKNKHPSDDGPHGPRRIAQISSAMINRLHEQVVRYWQEANNVNLSRTHALEIKYGKPKVTATGQVDKRLAEVLIEAGLLKEIRRVNGKPILGLDIKGSLTKEKVQEKIDEIEKFCFQIPGTKHRDERLPLCDNLEKDGEYVTYDRGLDMLGFKVHTVNVVTFLESIVNQFVYSGIIVNQRHPLLATQESDSFLDIVAGAIPTGFTRDSAADDEGKAEANIDHKTMDRKKEIGGYTTLRYRGKYTFTGPLFKGKWFEGQAFRGIVREDATVYVLGVRPDEVKDFSTKEKKALKQPDGFGGVVENKVDKIISYILVPADELLSLIENDNNLRNGKRLATVLAMLYAGLIPEHDQRRTRIEAIIKAQNLDTVIDNSRDPVLARRRINRMLKVRIRVKKAKQPPATPAPHRSILYRYLRKRAAKQEKRFP